MTAGLLTMAAWLAPALGLPQDGYIGGVVTNSSRGGQRVAGANVTLLQDTGRGFVLVDETTTDPAGRFLFRNLVVSSHIRYQAAAQFAGVHYPGPTIQLTDEHDTAAAVLSVRDVVREPNPLVVRDHQIALRPTPGMLEVTESLSLENPLPQTYVGSDTGMTDVEPTTLRLSIPEEFQKVTFHREAFGRAFAVRDGSLVTSRPWEPGRHVVSFTYVLRNSRAHCVWERTLDLPTDALRVHVTTAHPDRVVGNLSRNMATPPDTHGNRAYIAHATALPAGHVVRLELDQLPLAWTVYGKWLALVLLALLMIAHGLVRWRRALTAHHGPDDSGKDASSAPASSPARRNRKQGPHRRLRRAA